MKSQPTILKIALQTPLHRTFDYLSHNDMPPDQYFVGQRVTVPFGSRTMTGIILDISTHTEFPTEKLKQVIASIDEHNLFPNELISLYRFASDYYCHPIGDVILSSLPKKLKTGAPAIIKTNAIDHSPISDTTHTLTEEQDHAVTSINRAQHFQPYLLFGVTGSGKTEVYLHVIANILNQGKQALVLVPEISLTPQTVARFKARFQTPVLLLHSGLADGKRMQAWLTATQDKPCIIIGTRSAVFAPLKNLGIIVVDEEHDLSFKQQSRFRYHARDIAVMRAKLLNIPIVLGTATPSLESYHNVTQQKYQLLSLSQRAGKSTLPMLNLQDIRNQKLQGGLCKTVIAKIKTHLDNGNQVLIYLNRRGYAPVLICHHCGWTADCARCDAKLTVHHFSKKLVCHHCGFQKKVPTLCESCKQSEVMELGLGTEQLEQTLLTLFPKKSILRIDRDNTRTFSALESALDKIHQKKVDIIIGTQLLVKGHHFENVTLVAAIDTDNALFSSDFRAIERLGQSLIQVAGRAGRSQTQGEVIIQTHQPDHPHLNTLLQLNYLHFIEQLLNERHKAQLPPHRHMALLHASAKNQSMVMRFLEMVLQKINQEKYQLETIGPLPAVMAKKAGQFRANLLLQSLNRQQLHDTLSELVALLDAEKGFSSVRWVLDIDPMEFN